MQCQVCGSSELRFICEWSPYLDYAVDIFDCETCRSRFAPHDADGSEKLHSRSSAYLNHVGLEKKIVGLLEQGNIHAVKSYLSKRLANSFIIETVDSLPAAKNLLEIGCSRGYLAGYFLSQNRNVLGVDASPTAVSAATNSFGEHFCVPSDHRVQGRAPYDVIYHVGTIGCVASPMKMTKELLQLLKPGGVLVFNAPNKLTCESLGEVWVSAPPPDVVNLFHPEIWKETFSGFADVKVEALKAGRLTSGFVRMLAKINSTASVRLYDNEKPALSVWEKLRRKIIVLYFTLMYPSVPEEYGIHVIMKKNI